MISAHALNFDYPVKSKRSLKICFNDFWNPGIDSSIGYVKNVLSVSGK